MDKNNLMKPYWSGEPYKGIYIRPGDVNRISVCVIFSLIILYFSITNNELFAILPVISFIVYCTVGRLIIDANIRNDLTYELWPNELVILKKSSSEVMATIPIAALTNIKPNWDGDIASIDIPQGILVKISTKFDGFEKDIPSLRCGRRLELIENPVKVANLIRAYAILQVGHLS
jgi:hypothetical protein